MTENIDNLVIEHLKLLRNELRDFRANNERDFADMRQRLSHLERVFGTVKRDAVDQFDEAARQQTSIDAIMQRIERLERRLELNS